MLRLSELCQFLRNHPDIKDSWIKASIFENTINVDDRVKIYVELATYSREKELEVAYEVDQFLEQNGVNGDFASTSIINNWSAERVGEIKRDYIQPVYEEKQQWKKSHGYFNQI
ncbi:hypothetical protein [Ammoniphilus sp. YIM 78166]|uniref:hypothetical protein n=1 Tax=Ammoniphilus sp. YIM 78166 TaxID=1644106 RepID=UPI00106F100A|nr:hypothetical protein [Ammoniphilus sp. YIM 78166]